MKLIILVSLIVFLTACGKQNNAESIFKDQPFSSTDPNLCQESVKNSYVAKWKSGKVTVIKANSKKEIVEGFITKNLDKLDIVEPNYIIKIKPVSNTRSATSRNWHHIAVNSLYAWDRNIKGQGVVVGVIDSGLDTNHGQIRDQVFVNTNEIPNNQIDDDNNGFVDDYEGYDFYDDTGSMSDENGHGTHVSGIVSAEHVENPSSGNDITGSNYVFGIAPEAKILPIRFLGPQGEGSLMSAINAIDYASLRNVDIINASWGGTACSEILNQKVLDLEEEGILFVAAAGNESLNVDYTPVYPGSVVANHVINVGASSSVGAMASFSNFGLARVDLAAPGVDITSTVPFQSIENMSGTSMASPLVAGLAALIKSHRPNLSVQDLKMAVKNSVVPSSLMVETRGEVNVRTAIEALD